MRFPKSVQWKISGLLLFIAISSFTSEEIGEPYPFPELRFFPEMPYTDNPSTIEGVELGRFLFYDTILSENQTMSCGSCHQQERAFSDAPKRFSKGVNGELMTRNTMPLFNLAWYSSFFWDGRAGSLEEQVFFPVRAHSEMNLDWMVAVQRISKSSFYKSKFLKAFGNVEIDSVLIARSIAQFERTLISQDSKYDQVLRGERYFTKEEYEGFVLMNDQTKGDCLHCHTTDGDALGTTTGFSNNGLDQAKKAIDYSDIGKAGVTGKQQDIGRFRIPSLRNIEVTGPYMHDGRFNTLDQVIDFYSDGVQTSFNIDSKMEYAHQGGVHLTADEKKKIKAFLLTLTDSSFLNNPAFDNPFK